MVDSSRNVGIGTTGPATALEVNGIISIQDGGVKNRNAGIASGANAGLINFGINDSSSNRFGGAYTSADQGGFIRVDSRAGNNLFQFYGRAAGSTSAVASLLDITSTGNVGIGTTTPQTTLAVVTSTNGGGVSVSGTSGVSPSYQLRSLGTSKGVFGYAASANDWVTGTAADDIVIKNETSAGKIDFITNGTLRAVIDSSGNVGIGTTSPQNLLHVNGASDGLGYIRISDQSIGSLSTDGARIGYNSGALRIQNYENTNMSFFVNNTTEAFTIKNDGNVGIGTTDPGAARLKVKSNITGAGSATLLLDNSGTVSNESGIYFANSTSNDSSSFPSGRIYTKFDSTTYESSRLTLQSLDSGGSFVDTLSVKNGNVGIGTTGPTFTSGIGGLEIASNFAGIRLTSTEGTDQSFETHVDSTDSYVIYDVTDTATRFKIDTNGNVGIGTTGPGARLDVKETVTGAGGWPGRFWNSVANGPLIQFLNTSGAEVGSITQNGTATAYNTSSDERLKENISDWKSGLELLSQVKVREYDWKSDGSHSIGFIAQELKEVYPAAVWAPEDGMWSVDYSKLVPMLAGAIQEMYAQFSELKDTVLALATRIVSDEVVVNNQLCMEELCINKEQFRTILENNGIVASASQSSNDQAPITNDQSSSNDQSTNEETATSTEEVIVEEEETATTTEPVIEEEAVVEPEPMAQPDEPLVEEEAPEEVVQTE